MNITQIENNLTLASIESPQYGYVHITQKVTISGSAVYKTYFTLSTSTVYLETDGYYQIVEIKLPASEGYGYWIDVNSGGTGVVYDPEGSEVPIEDLLALPLNTANIVREDQDLISTYLLQTYYILLIKSRFLNNICSCDCPDKEEKLKIDILTMGLALIEYLKVYAQYYEIERIIEQTTSCVGVTLNSCNCG